MTGNPAYALWSPHRDSREVMLWKSLLSFRQEPWHWVEDGESALWHVVDVSRGVDPAWTARLGGRRQVRGIALARQWLDIPAPVWTFFKVPLVTEDVHRWLEAELRGATFAQAQQAGQARLAKPGEDAWSGRRLKLSRWPDVGRYGENSIALTVACSLMLRDWTPYEELIRVIPAQTPLLALLADASQRGILQVTAETQSAIPAPATPPVTHGAEDEGRWGLLKRIWKRFQ